MYTVPFSYPVFSFEKAVSLACDTGVISSDAGPLLETVVEMLDELKRPDAHFDCIQIAGTNGKTSTTRFTAAILRGEGLRCALYTSPQLVRYPERMEIDGAPISDDLFAQGISAAYEAGRRVNERRAAAGENIFTITPFDLLTVAALTVYALEGVDVAVLEVGMGGRWDATSATDPHVVAITGIGLDHMRILGNTLAEIAGEKAGIMVPGVPVIYDGNDPDAAGVMREHAEKLGCPYYELKREDTEIHKITKDGIRFSLKDETYGDTVFDIPFIARYQVMNAALAVKTIQVLEDQIPVSLEALKAGMAKTRWQGRMETVLPGVIVDGAHNEDGVEKFVETAEHFQKEFPLTLLFSAVDDKDYTDMIRTICSRIRFRHVIVTQVGGYRKVPVEELAEIFREDGVPEVEAIEDVPAAFERAVKEKGEDGMLFCVGSLYLVGEIKAVIRRKKL